MRLLLLVVIALVGCSNAAADGPDVSMDHDVAIQDLGHDQAEQLPDLVVDAPEDPVEVADYCEATVDMFCAYYLRCGRIDADDPDDCRSKFLETCNAVFEPQYVALADRGQLALSTDGVQSCAEHLVDVSCERHIFDLDGPCRDVWDGQAAAGESCAPGVGVFVCEKGTECVLDLSLCGTCEPAGSAGGACVEGRCDRESICIADQCEPRGLTGDACDEDRICATGLSCMNGECSAYVVAPSGGSCAAARCPYQSTCTSDVCVPVARNGESCADGEVCGAGFCDGETCQPFRGDGDACGTNAQCLSGRCEDAVCAPTLSMCFES